jgi:hypothetical protein
LLVSLSGDSREDFFALMREEKIQCALQHIGTMTIKKEFVVSVVV